MEIKPLNETSTIQIPIRTQKITTLTKVKTHDPDNIIPNGIYKVIKWENFRQFFAIALSLIIFAISVVMISLYATNVLHIGWAGYLIPAATGTISFYKLITTIFENKFMRKAVERYKENLGIEINSTPAFVAKLYKSLHVKQVSHNWLTFMFIFYGGIFTLLLWWLKDVSWWIFHFNAWIKDIWTNPEIMVWIATGALIAIAFMHIVFAIQRKKRILEIDAYFGLTLIPEGELATIKEVRNKFWRRVFILSVMTILVIPLITMLIMKLISRKK